MSITMVEDLKIVSVRLRNKKKQVTQKFQQYNKLNLKHAYKTLHLTIARIYIL